MALAVCWGAGLQNINRLIRNVGSTYEDMGGGPVFRVAVMVRHRKRMRDGRRCSGVNTECRFHMRIFGGVPRARYALRFRGYRS